MQESYTPVIINKIGSLYANGPIEKTPKGMSPEVRNCKFIGDSVRMRYGLTTTAQSQDQARVTGALNFVLSDSQYLLTFNAAGRIEYEANEGQGNMATTVGGFGSGSGLGANLYGDFAQAYNRAFMTLTSLRTPSDVPVMTFKNGSAITSTFIATDNNATPISTAASSAAAGDVNTGVRYIIVLFETASGYISGVTSAAVFEATGISTASRKVDLTGIPTGPAEVVRRWVAFTEVGAPSAGPYFYIPENIAAPELTADITATMVNDNTTTTATFNFTDDALVAGVEVTDFFDKIRLPAQNAVFFSPTLRRVIWAGETANPTMFRVSEPDDPETYFGSTGYVAPGTNDGDPAITAREFKSEVYLLKGNSGYVVHASNNPPNEWQTTRRWIGVGPAGPWAVDVGDDFMAIAARGGLHIYTGESPQNITTATMKDVWERVNWSVGHLVWVLIDHDEQEIHVGLPLDYASVPNARLTVYYGAGFDKLKWSLDDIYTTREIAVDRDLPVSPNPEVPVDSRVAAAQTLALSAEPNGAVNYLDPSRINDNNVPITQVWRSGFVAPAEAGVYTIGGVDITASGQGVITPSVYRDNTQTPVALRQIVLTPHVKDHSIKMSGHQSERFSVRVANGSMADSAFVLTKLTLYLRYMWMARTI